MTILDLTKETYQSKKPKPGEPVEPEIDAEFEETGEETAAVPAAFPDRDIPDSEIYEKLETIRKFLLKWIKKSDIAKTSEELEPIAEQFQNETDNSVYVVLGLIKDFTFTRGKKAVKHSFKQKYPFFYNLEKNRIELYIPITENGFVE